VRFELGHNTLIRTAPDLALEQIDTSEQKRNTSFLPQADPMPADPKSQPTPEPDRLELATDEAIGACGGNARDAVKALIVANEYLESEVCELMQAVSHAYARGRFKTYTG